ELGNKFPAQSLNPLKRVQRFTRADKRVIIMNSVVPNRDYTLFLCGLRYQSDRVSTKPGTCQ
ncbi:hypothetical protein, partial [Coleofasciculus sp.]|uniref:hypothetical protein n=1 Tax=Coleofasciculus sp. TaxID=3100458 RepID=UPI003A48AEBA